MYAILANWSLASGMRQLPGTLRFQVVQESHTSGLTPAARLWVAGKARAGLFVLFRG